MIKRCIVCDEEFVTYPSKVKIGRGKYCSKECCLLNTALTGEEGIKTRFSKNRKPHNFKGWRYQQSRKGGGRYILIFKPGHPHCTKAGYVREHRLVMEKKLGRYLEKGEIVHHKDDDSENNTIDNLELMSKINHDRQNVKLNIHKRWRMNQES